MSSPAKNATTKADQPRPIPALAPTLLLVPSFEIPGTTPASDAVPAILPVPATANKKLHTRLPRNSAPDDFNPELKRFFSGEQDNAPAPVNKGKGPAPPAPPPPSPPPPTEGPTEGASTSLHPLFKRVGFSPDAKVPSRFTTADHRNTCVHLADAVCEMARMDDRLGWIQHDLTDAADSLNTQLNSLGEFVNAQINKRTTHHDDSYTADLVLASNKHATNGIAAQNTIKELSTHMAALEDIAPTASHVTRITQMEARIDSLATTTQTILARVSALCGSSLPAPPPAEVNLSDLDPATLKELLCQVLNGKGKRARDDDSDDSVRNVRQNTGALVTIPASFQHIPQAHVAPMPPVVATAPVSLLEQTPPVPLFPPASAPAPPAPPVSAFPPTAIPAPLPPPPAAVPSAPPPWAPPVAATAYLSAPAATQTAAPPLTHQVLFEPINFGADPKLAKGEMVRIIAHILPNTGRLTFRLRCAGDKNHTFAVFESEAVATWVVGSWAATNGTRGQYEVVTARAMGPNA
ncbi:hypothetical protein DFH08DRAFT_1086566 [Mycena albidolilacea]|uniref:Uncharacterized protein n=1 Tax=Mycena albidolilacea TaxID=1033008 RepID=A0AAD6ZDW7_9AGAR|nr:hypothetical protein DFH08DRAFT_1086566 [Mycena albidolilacea]